MERKNVFITGASSGIGESCAYSFAAKGWNLILTARRIQKLEEIKKSITEKYNTEVQVFPMDVTDHSQVESVFLDLKDTQIDVLINNAGLAQEATSFQSYEWNDFQTMIDTNITGFLKVAHTATPHILESKGHIINVSSVAGIEAYEGGSVYCASKAFVKMVSKALRIDFAGTGVRVTDIANTILFAVESPARMNVEYMLVMPTAQISATRTVKSEV